MALTTIERWIAGVGIVAIAGAAYWLGSLENRVSRLEKSADQVAMGPRGENCQQIVGKLVERPNDPALRQLADQWGCSGFAAATAAVPTDNATDAIANTDAPAAVH
jgi:hypothetical protein